MPTKQELEKFLEVFDKLSNYEANQRMNRFAGGIFKEKDLPIPEVKKVYKWLENLSNSNNEE